MSLENERQKCQLPSCENRMSIKDRVLKILVSDYIELFSPTVSPQLRFAVPAVSVPKVMILLVIGWFRYCTRR